MSLRDAAQQALEALRLSVPKPRSKDDDYIEQGWKEHSDAISVLCSALTKPEQEPIAWITPGQDLHLVNYEGFQDWVPLYTAPPTREPLTESFLEELAEKHVTHCYFDTLTYAREIESLHGIGGEK